MLSGVLKCGSCGGSYVMANDRNYRCSSQTNGRAPICTQRKCINRVKAEEKQLEGIKAEMLAPSFIKAVSKRVRARLREIEQPDEGTLKRKLAEIDREIDNVTESIAKVGGSKALLSRLAKLEAGREAIVSEIASASKPARLVPNVERVLRERIKTLESIPRDKLVDADLAERARLAVRSVLPEVKVIEDGDHVYAEVDLGRQYIIHGAQERT